MISIKRTKEFIDWLHELTLREQGQIVARLERIQNADHFGDAKNLGNGLAELRWKKWLADLFF